MLGSGKQFFVFSYFKGHGDGLHLAGSSNGYHWRAFNDDRPFLSPQAGPEKIMRDPFLLPGPDGWFHLVWTAGWRGRGIGYARSRDLIDWSSQEFLPVMENEPLAVNCWAPEILYDDCGEQFILFWASTIPGRFPATDHTGDEGLNHRIYYVTTRDFISFSKTRLFFDVGFNVIDATIVKDDGRYVMFVKDETRNPCEKNIRVALSNNIFGGFDTVSAPITGDYWAEGPTAIRISGEWIVYFDKYKVNEIGAVRSRDLRRWEDISDQVVFPRGAQHGSVATVTLESVKHLL